MTLKPLDFIHYISAIVRTEAWDKDREEGYNTKVVQGAVEVSHSYLPRVKPWDKQHEIS